MIIEKEKILWKPRNARIVCGGLVYIGTYVHGVNILTIYLMRNIYIMNKEWYEKAAHNRTVNASGLSLTVVPAVQY